MLDGQIVAALMTEIRTQLVSYGINTNDLRVARSDQPTAQNAGSKKFEAYITPVTNTDVGWLRRYGNDYSSLTINHVDQSSYQISTLTLFNPANPNDIPAQDLAKIIHDMIQHPDAIRTLKSKGVDIQECSPVRPSFQLNDSDEFESMPSFDVTVSYNSAYTKAIPVVTSADGEITGV